MKIAVEGPELSSAPFKEELNRHIELYNLLLISRGGGGGGVFGVGGYSPPLCNPDWGG